MRYDYINSFVDSAERVMENYMPTKIQRGTVTLKDSITAQGISATIFLVGSVDGRVVLDVEPLTAKKIAGHMNGREFDRLEHLVLDTICELTNVIIGKAITSLNNKGFRFRPSPPCFFIGKKIYPGIETLCICLSSEWGEMNIQVCGQGSCRHACPGNPLNIVHILQKQEVRMLKRNQVVRFMVGKESFGVDIGMIQEIVTLPDITRVPDTPEFMEGIINLRGKIISVIDLRKKLGSNGSGDKKKNRILVTQIDGRVVGLIVDEVSEVLRLNPDNIEPPPEMVDSVGVEYITGIGKLEDRIIILLDLAKVLSTHEIDRLVTHDEVAAVAMNAAI